MLLHLARERIKVARAGVRADGSPICESLAGSGDGSGYIVCAALRDGGELLAGGRIVGIEIFAGGGRRSVALRWVLREPDRQERDDQQHDQPGHHRSHLGIVLPGGKREVTLFDLYGPAK